MQKNISYLCHNHILLYFLYKVEFFLSHLDPTVSGLIEYME